MIGASIVNIKKHAKSCQLILSGSYALDRGHAPGNSVQYMISNSTNNEQIMDLTGPPGPIISAED